jgi:hypothetical protein
MHLVFLVEELSMKLVLDKLLPKLLSSSTSYKIIPHEGCQDLLRAIPKLIQYYKPKPYLFVVLIDKDANYCKQLKQKIIQSYNASHNVLVRIVCTELESWLLGDLSAIDKAYGTQLGQLQQQQKYRNPDTLGNAKQEFKRLLAEKRIFKKHLDSIQAVATELNPNKNQSPSFNVFISGLKGRLTL